MNSLGYTPDNLLLRDAFWQSNGLLIPGQHIWCIILYSKQLLWWSWAEAHFSACPVRHCQHTRSKFWLSLSRLLISDIPCCPQLIRGSFVQNNSSPAGFSASLLYLTSIWRCETVTMLLQTLLFSHSSSAPFYLYYHFISLHQPVIVQSHQPSASASSRAALPTAANWGQCHYLVSFKTFF